MENFSTIILHICPVDIANSKCTRTYFEVRNELNLCTNLITESMATVVTKCFGMHNGQILL